MVSELSVSAVALDPEQTLALRAALEKVSVKTVELETKVDASVLGGLRVTLGGRTLDGTVVAQLGALRRHLQGAA